jgi:hypothetical protein
MSRLRQSPLWVGGQLHPRSDLSLDSAVGSRRSLCAGFGEPVSRPVFRRRRDGTVPSSWGTPHPCAPGRCPGGAGSSGHCDEPVLPSACFKATAPTMTRISGLFTAAHGVRCLRFASTRVTRRFARLASGCWPDFAGQGSFTPTGIPSRGFHSALGQVMFPPLPSFAWRSKPALQRYTNVPKDVPTHTKA